MFEELANLLSPKVEGGPDDMTRALVSGLHDPLAQIGFDDLDAEWRELVIELDFLANHRFRFDDQLGAVLLAYLAHDLDHIGRAGGGMDFGSGALCLFSELRQKAIELVGDVGLDALELDTQLLEIDFIERAIAGTAPVLLVRAMLRARLGLFSAFS